MDEPPVTIACAITASATADAFIQGRTRTDERMPSGRPVHETWFGDNYGRAKGRWMRLQRTIDRKSDRYFESITERDGTVVRLIDEPLSRHRGRGSDYGRGAGR